MKKHFTIKQVIAALGITRERFKEWVLRGYVTPSVLAGVGPGRSNVYDVIDIYVAKVFKELLDRGINRSVAHELAQRLEIGISARLLEYAGYSGKMYLVFFVGQTIDDLRAANSNLYTRSIQIIRERDIQRLPSIIQSVRETFSFSMMLMIDFGELKAEVDKRIGI